MSLEELKKLKEMLDGNDNSGEMENFSNKFKTILDKSETIEINEDLLKKYKFNPEDCFNVSNEEKENNSTKFLNEKIDFINKNILEIFNTIEDIKFYINNSDLNNNSNE